MTTQLQLLKEKLFGETGVHASNFKMYRGSNSNASVEEVAAALNASLDRVAAGECTDVAEIGG